MRGFIIILAILSIRLGITYSLSLRSIARTPHAIMLPGQRMHVAYPPVPQCSTPPAVKPTCSNAAQSYRLGLPSAQYRPYLAGPMQRETAARTVGPSAPAPLSPCSALTWRLSSGCREIRKMPILWPPTQDLYPNFLRLEPSPGCP